MASPEFGLRGEGRRDRDTKSVEGRYGESVPSPPTMGMGDLAAAAKFFSSDFERPKYHIKHIIMVMYAVGSP